MYRRCCYTPPPFTGYAAPVTTRVAAVAPPKSHHTHPFNGPFSGTTQVSRYQKGKTNLDFTEATDSEWQWHQLGYMHYASLHLAPDRQPSQHPTTLFFTGRMPFLPPNQQRQSSEGKPKSRNLIRRRSTMMWSYRRRSRSASTGSWACAVPTAR